MTGWKDHLERLCKMQGYEKPPTAAGLRLDSNENLLIPQDMQHEMLKTSADRIDVREYPKDSVQRLVRALSGYLSVPEDMISVGNGSDQILDMILAHLVGSGAKTVVTEPTFSFFVDRCRLHGITTVQVPCSDDMMIDCQTILKESRGADMIYLDSPNNPTGYQIPQRDLQEMVESFEGFVVLDEAYAEFAEYSAHQMAVSAPNLIVVRTMSKAFGLAGLRVGYVVAGNHIIEPFSRIVQHPYPLSSISAETALLALERAVQVSHSWDTARLERGRIVKSLQEYDAFRVFDSKANFVLFDAGSAHHRVHKALSEQGISIRKIGRVGGYEGCLRVTVGPREANSRFLLAVRDLLK